MDSANARAPHVVFAISPGVLASMKHYDDMTKRYAATVSPALALMAEIDKVAESYKHAMPKVDMSSMLPKIDMSSMLPKVDISSMLPKIDSSAFLGIAYSAERIREASLPVLKMQAQVDEAMRPFLRIQAQMDDMLRPLRDSLLAVPTPMVGHQLVATLTAISPVVEGIVTSRPSIEVEDAQASRRPLIDRQPVTMSDLVIGLVLAVTLAPLLADGFAEDAETNLRRAFAVSLMLLAYLALQSRIDPPD